MKKQKMVLPSKHSNFASINTEDFDEILAPHELKGHVRLWASVLLLAIVDYSKYLRNQNTPQKKAKQWITEEKARGIEAYAWIYAYETDEPHSFRWVCRMLGYDPDKLRKIIKRDYEKNANLRIEEPKTRIVQEDDYEEPVKRPYIRKVRHERNKNITTVDVVDERRMRGSSNKTRAFPDNSHMQAA